MRSDTPIPGDLYVVARGLYAKDVPMGLMISSCITQSCLLQASRSSDYVLQKGDDVNFNKDLRNSEPIQLLAFQRLSLW
jgi:hypothetical protein